MEKKVELKHAHVVWYLPVSGVPKDINLRELIPWEQIGGKPEEKRK